MEDLLRAHIEAGQGLFRGIRQHASWDASDDVPKSRIDPPPHLYRDGDFREGFARLAPLGLSFDAWNFHPQIPELAALARAFPEITIVLNHLGGPLGIGPYADRRDEVFSCWQRDLSALAACAKVVVKLGGIAMDLNGFGWHERDRPPTSDELAVAQRPYILHAIECFGPARCMFESNFPVEKLYVSYGFYRTPSRKSPPSSRRRKKTRCSGAQLNARTDWMRPDWLQTEELERRRPAGPAEGLRQGDQGGQRRRQPLPPEQIASDAGYSTSWSLGSQSLVRGSQRVPHLSLITTHSPALRLPWWW